MALTEAARTRMLRNFILTGREWWMCGGVGLIRRNEIHSSENGPATRMEIRGEKRKRELDKSEADERQNRKAVLKNSRQSYLYEIRIQRNPSYQCPCTPPFMAH